MIGQVAYSDIETACVFSADKPVSTVPTYTGQSDHIPQNQKILQFDNQLPVVQMYSVFNGSVENQE